MQIHFTVPGQPVAKGRPRLSKFGAYTPQKTVNYENLVKTCYMEQVNKKLMGELVAELIMYFKIPKSSSKNQRQMMISGDIRPSKRPDLDNVLKAVMDSLNNIAYDDDSQVVGVNVNKFYGDKAGRGQIDGVEGMSQFDMGLLIGVFVGALASIWAIGLLHIYREDQ